MFITILSFIALLAVLVLAHEWGHFFAARRLGVGVNEFGFGFPPRVFGVKRGATTYSLNWIPLGGFVRLKGENIEERGPDSFAVQLAWRRTVILVAGVAMNAVLAWVLLALGFMIGFPTLLQGNDSLRAHDVKLEVISIAPESPISQTTLAVGDTVLTLDGKTFMNVPELQTYVSGHASTPIDVAYMHDGALKYDKVQPQVLSETSGRAVLGVGLLQTGVISYPWYEALWRGLTETWRLAGAILSAFGGLITNLVVHQQVPSDVAGPVGIAVLTGEVARLGFIYLLQFAAMLSLNLAIINILPIPALDGGRLLFVVIEKIRRKPNNERVEAVVHQIGFVALMGLVLLVTYNDVARLSGDFFGKLGNLWGL